MIHIHHLLLFDTSSLICRSIFHKKKDSSHSKNKPAKWRKVIDTEEYIIKRKNQAIITKHVAGYFSCFQLEKLVINNLDIVKKAEYLFPLSLSRSRLRLSITCIHFYKLKAHFTRKSLFEIIYIGSFSLPFYDSTRNHFEDSKKRIVKFTICQHNKPNVFALFNVCFIEQQFDKYKTYKGRKKEETEA